MIGPILIAEGVVAGIAMAWFLLKKRQAAFVVGALALFPSSGSHLKSQGPERPGDPAKTHDLAVPSVTGRRPSTQRQIRMFCTR